MSFILYEKPIFLVGPSIYLPDNIMTNENIIKWMNNKKATSERIEARTGIRERRWVSNDQACSDIATIAAEIFFAEHEIDKNSIDNLLLATISGDYPSPPSSPLIAGKLGLNNIGVIDIGAACAGFVTALYIASSMSISSLQNQLLISADIRSKFLNKNDYSTAVIFGDAATCSLVTNSPKNASFKIIASELGADPALADIISIQAGGSRLPFYLNDSEEKQFLKMKDGATLFAMAVDLMVSSAQSIIEKLGISIHDVDWIVPHQANLILMRATADRLEFPEEKMAQTVQFTGNISGSSIGIALNHLMKIKPVKKNDKILLVSAGAGGSTACSYIEAM